jgi:hypothetical protein
LLPLELGETQYEKGADGLMLTVMTDPQCGPLFSIEREAVQAVWELMNPNYVSGYGIDTFW